MLNVLIKRIKLESGFYKIFRNIIRSMLGEYENSETRTKIQEIINSKDYYYVDKIERIKTLLIKMLVIILNLLIWMINYY